MSACGDWNLNKKLFDTLCDLFGIPDRVKVTKLKVSIDFNDLPRITIERVDPDIEPRKVEQQFAIMPLPTVGFEEIKGTPVATLVRHPTDAERDELAAVWARSPIRQVVSEYASAQVFRLDAEMLKEANLGMPCSQCGKGTLRPIGESSLYCPECAFEVGG